jgi:pimeloyl-ACP methyl ester carboxylesterase
LLSGAVNTLTGIQKYATTKMKSTIAWAAHGLGADKVVRNCLFPIGRTGKQDKYAETDDAQRYFEQRNRRNHGDVEDPEDDNEEVILTCLDGVQLAARHVKHSNSRHAKTAILFHGNGMTHEHWKNRLGVFKEKLINVLAITIRGYGRSGGNVNNVAYGIPLDVEAAVRYLAKDNPHYKNHTFVYGLSLGSLHATYAARHFKLPAILDHPLTKPADCIMNPVSIDVLLSYLLGTGEIQPMIDPYKNIYTFIKYVALKKESIQLTKSLARASLFNFIIYILVNSPYISDMNILFKLASITLPTALEFMGYSPLSCIYPDFLFDGIANSVLYGCKKPDTSDNGIGLFQNIGHIPPCILNNVEDLKNTDSSVPILIAYGREDSVMGGETGALRLFNAVTGNREKLHSLPGGHCDHTILDFDFDISLLL